MDLLFEAVDEDQPGAKWRQLFDRHWHAYSRWFMRDGIRARPTYLASLKAMRAHMPELLPAYEAIVSAAGDGDLEASEVVRVGAEVDLLGGDAGGRGRIVPSNDLVGGQTHGGSLGLRFQRSCDRATPN